jgi:hypothetical protein
MCLALAPALAAAHPPQAPVRDRVAVPAAGTGSIQGIVYIDGPEPRPARRARVVVSSSDTPTRASVITDDDGRFTVTGLPAGRFTLSVTKDAFVTTAFGARRPGRPGTSIALNEGEQLKGLTIRLPRGAVISGQVSDLAGQPAAGVQVRAMRHVFGTDGKRLLVPVGAGATTDDRGMYRMYGFPPGDYTVGATVPRDAFASSTDLIPTTEAEMAATRQAIAGGSAAIPGQAAAAHELPPLPRPVSFASVYHPGTTRVDDAAVIPLEAGEERGGVDLQIQLAPTARVEGTIAAPEGVQTGLIVVNLIATGSAAPPFMGEGYKGTRPDADGRFAFTSVAPGGYAIVARAGAPAKEKGASGPPLWAAADLDVQGADVSNISLQLQEGTSVEGRIAFDATSTPVAGDLPRFQVMLESAAAGNQVSLGATPAQSDATGAFRVSGVAPGRYRLSVQPLRGLLPAWGVKAAVLNGRDVRLEPFDVAFGENISDIVVTLTDHPAEIRGTLQDTSGAPSSDYFIIVFPVDPGLRVTQPARVQATRPAQDGSYRARVPPGEYLLVALIDVEQNEWRDPAFLQRIAANALRFTLGDGEQKVQDLRLGGS